MKRKIPKRKKMQTGGAPPTLQSKAAGDGSYWQNIYDTTTDPTRKAEAQKQLKLIKGLTGTEKNTWLEGGQEFTYDPITDQKKREAAIRKAYGMDKKAISKEPMPILGMGAGMLGTLTSASYGSDDAAKQREAQQLMNDATSNVAYGTDPLKLMVEQERARQKGYDITSDVNYAGRGAVQGGLKGVEIGSNFGPLGILAGGALGAATGAALGALEKQDLAFAEDARKKEERQRLLSVQDEIRRNIDTTKEENPTITSVNVKKGGKVKMRNGGNPPASNFKRLYGHAKDYGVGSDRGLIDPKSGYKYFPTEGQDNFVSNQKSSVPEHLWNTSRFLFQPFIAGESQGVHNAIYDSKGNYMGEKELFQIGERTGKRFKRAKEDITNYYGEDLNQSGKGLRKNVRGKMKDLRKMNRAQNKMGEYYFKDFQDPNYIFEDAVNLQENSPYQSLRYPNNPYMKKPLSKGKAKKAYTKFQKAWRGTSGKEARKNSRNEIEKAKQKKLEFENQIADHYGMTLKEVQKSKGKFDKERVYKNGGTIVGPGTGTSDSIPGELEPNDFVAIASKKKEADALRKKYGLANQNATLKKGGNAMRKIPVKVSNGETLFTNREIKHILAQGGTLDELNALAPNADVPLQDGGTPVNNTSDLLKQLKEAEALVKKRQDYWKFVEKTIAKTEAGKILNEKIKQSNETHAERRKHEVRKLEDAIKQIKGEIEFKKSGKDIGFGPGVNSPGGAKRLNDAKKQLAKSSNKIKELDYNIEIVSNPDNYNLQEEGALGSILTPATYVLDPKKRTPLSSKKPDSSKKPEAETITEDFDITETTDLGTDDLEGAGVLKLQDTTTGVSTLPTTSKSKKPPTKTGSTAPSQSSTATTKREEIPLIENPLLQGLSKEDIDKMREEQKKKDMEKMDALRPEVEEDVEFETDGTETEEKVTEKEELPWSDILGLGQAAMGIRGLSEDQRPIGVKSADLAAQKARIDAAESGFTIPIDETLRQIERERMAASIPTSGERGYEFAKRAVATTGAMSAKQKALENKYIAEQQAKDRFGLTKLGLQGQMAGALAAEDRRLFQDDMQAFQQKQAAYAGLLNAGISNFIQGREARATRRAMKDIEGDTIINLG